jgi:hypothetical protein
MSLSWAVSPQFDIVGGYLTMSKKDNPDPIVLDGEVQDMI